MAPIAADASALVAPTEHGAHCPDRRSRHRPRTGPQLEVPSVSVEQKFARSLGVFSLALGAVQLVAPRRFAKAIGVTPSRERPGVVRLVGAREAAAAAGLFVAAGPRRPPRVGGCGRAEGNPPPRPGPR